MAEIQRGNVLVNVVILYWPDTDTIKFLNDLGANGTPVIAVVNGIDPHIKSKLETSIALEIIDNGENLGLARALNQGCERAFESGATHVFLLDQDSRPENNLATELLQDFVALERDGHMVGAIGPRLIDVKGSDVSLGKHSVRTVPGPNFNTVDTLATSGSMISEAAFKIVGGMYDWLFIDDIDHEWCFRAQQAGFRLFRSNSREMLHNMGDQGVTIMGRYRPLHRSPIRHFYITRNTVFMIRQPYVRLGWRLREAAKMLYRIPTYILISTNRLQSLQKVIKGFYDGVQHNSNPRIERID